jgi:cell volume regulation protein A
MTIESLLVLAGALLLFSVLASKATSRLGVPSLLLFLVVGMLAGSEGPGGIPFDDPYLAQSVGVLALAFILFAGGLETDWSSVSAVAAKGLSLATIGVLATAVLTGVFSSLLLGLSWQEGLLLGSIVSSTDAAAVFSVLRSRGASLKGRLRPLLELESGSNDPMAVFLTIGFVRLLTIPGAALGDLIPMFVLQMTVGAAAGFLVGKGGILLLNRVKLESDGLYPVITVALVLLTYGATTFLKGNGFLAVYLAGILLGNGEFIHKKSLIRFHDGMAWLMQIAMFLTLGLQVFPSHLAPVAGAALLISFFLMFVARPVSVFLSLAFSRMPLRSKLMVSWVGLRGAVPIILATFPLLAGVPNAELYFNVVFFIVLTSVLLQGTTLPVVAKWLGVRAPLPPRRDYPLEFVPGRKTTSEMVEVEVPEDSEVIGRQLVDLGLPKSALIVLLSRNDAFLVPRGSTVLQPGDRMLVLVEKDDMEEFRKVIGAKRRSPVKALSDDEET